MRRFLQFIGFLLLAFVLFLVSSDTYPNLMQVPERPTVEPTPSPTPVDSVEEMLYHATIQYGTPEVIKNNNRPLYTYIRFPQGGNPTDDVISSWAHSLYSGILADFQAIQETESSAIGEINVHFDSYLVDNRYAGIFQEGEYTLTLDPLVPPEEVIKTFNIDLSNNTFLDSTDILDYSKSDSILELLRDKMETEHPDTERYLSFIDVSWLNLLVIGNDGIIVILDKYRLLPDMFDTLTVILPYEDLGDALLIRRDPPLAAVPESTPVPEPTPTPDISETSDPDEDDPDEDDPDDPDDHDDPDDPDDSEPSVPPQSGNIDPSKPMIALTLDDGPGKYTDQFLDLFEKYGIRATFCVIGNLVNTQEEALVRAVSLGNEVIGHSWDHKNLAKLSADAVERQITDTFNVIDNVAGTDVKLFRPPYGAVSDTMREASRELGFSMVYWTVDPEDWNTKDSQAILHAVVNGTIDGSIILSHEIYKSTLVAYESIIPELLIRGFQFVTISELLQHKFGDISPGEVYPLMR